uniref:CMP-N-acetylneuraminate-beta-1,4-galactoside alpha-2,3-sialyltransferase n=1 Tax=Knipowitschia caucasica TaxID=637954 RepID=A0AAV2JVD3_KNICA
MKPTHKLLFVLCPMLVLGFIYYSSGKLHLHVWGQKSLYDKQGFLLQLDIKLPTELMYKYGNLSEGTCKPGYAAAKMTAIYPKFVKPAPMFLDRNFKRLGKVNSYLPPFGFKTQERIIDGILTATKSYGLGEELDSLSCKRCIIVGNGGILANKSLGPKIDDYDVVVRLNEAPVSGFGRDVGTKTTMRITYPEGAIQKPENYEKDSLFVFSAFKPLDFKWLRHMVYKEKLWTGFDRLSEEDRSRRSTESLITSCLALRSVRRYAAREAPDSVGAPTTF